MNDSILKNIPDPYGIEPIGDSLNDPLNPINQQYLSPQNTLLSVTPPLLPEHTITGLIENPNMGTLLPGSNPTQSIIEPAQNINEPVGLNALPVLEHDNYVSPEIHNESELATFDEFEPPDDHLEPQFDHDFSLLGHDRFKTDHSDNIENDNQDDDEYNDKPVDTIEKNLNQNFQDTTEKKTDSHKEKLWNDSDYPFLPRPKGGGGTGFSRNYRRNVLKVRRKITKCVICGRKTDGTYYCSLCSGRTSNLSDFLKNRCPTCGLQLVDGKCINPDCPLSEKLKCPECGEEINMLPCSNCGFK